MIIKTLTERLQEARQYSKHFHARYDYLFLQMKN